jgi:hypothetical protein
MTTSGGCAAKRPSPTRAATKGIPAQGRPNRDRHRDDPHTVRRRHARRPRVARGAHGHSDPVGSQLGADALQIGLAAATLRMPGVAPALQHARRTRALRGTEVITRHLACAQVAGSAVKPVIAVTMSAPTAPACHADVEPPRPVQVERHQRPAQGPDKIWMRATSRSAGRPLRSQHRDQAVTKARVRLALCLRRVSSRAARAAGCGRVAGPPR